MILDVGPKSIALYSRSRRTCATLVWNGPLGAFEIKPFDAGTVALAQAVAELTEAGKLLSVAGGGDTVAALAQPASRTSSPTSRRRAAPSSNGWKARPCPALRR